MKSILAINGSPRKNGLTASLLRVFQDKIENLNTNLKEGDTNSISCNILHLNEFTINHCSGCDACLRKPNTCPLSENDDMLKLEEAMKNADAIIIGSPSYFNSPPGIVKDLIDRSRPMKMAKYQLKDKIFSSIGSAGLKGGGIVPVHSSLMRFALIQGMIVVASLGHPLLHANFPGEILQKEGLADFRKPTEIGDISTANTQALAKRVYDLLTRL